MFKLLMDLPKSVKHPLVNADLNLTARSGFFDIGCGLGYPCFLATYFSGCYSQGVDLVDARVQGCNKALKQIEKDPQFNKIAWDDRVSFA